MLFFEYICRIMRKPIGITALFAVTAVMLGSALSCAKTVSDSDALNSRRAFNAWIHVHYPELEGKAKSNGLYVLEDIPGDGEQIAVNNYIYYNYEVRNLYDSTLVAYNSGILAQDKKVYSKNSYYGPAWVYFGENDSNAAFKETVLCKEMDAMRMGGSRTVIIPDWVFASTKLFDSEQGYIDNNASGNSVIYRIEPVKMTDDIVQFQIDTTEIYLKSKGINPRDIDTTGCKGLYFFRDRLRELKRGVEAEMDVTFPKDTTIYIEYIGRLLNGKVFDTNIQDTAIKYGLGTRSKKYSPSKITWASDSTEIKMGGNSIIKGFSRILWKMHPFESATGVFISDWGYGASGSGNTIPSYAPLVFEIDIVEAPE